MRQDSIVFHEFVKALDVAVGDDITKIQQPTSTSGLGQVFYMPRVQGVLPSTSSQRVETNENLLPNQTSYYQQTDTARSREAPSNRSPRAMRHIIVNA
jgi:hypothetical protein